MNYLVRACLSKLYNGNPITIPNDEGMYASSWFCQDAQGADFYQVSNREGTAWQSPNPVIFDWNSSLNVKRARVDVIGARGLRAGFQGETQAATSSGATFAIEAFRDKRQFCLPDFEKWYEIDWIPERTADENSGMKIIDQSGIPFGAKAQIYFDSRDIRDVFKGQPVIVALTLEVFTALAVVQQ